MSDVSGIPYMGPMGVGNLFASPYPALSGGGNMSAGQISAPYAGPSAYNQSVLSPYNLYGAGGFGAATDYYSALGASYGRATGGFGADSTQDISPAGGYGDLGIGASGGGGGASYPSAYDVFSAGAPAFNDYGGGGAPFGGGGFGGLGGGGLGGGPSAYDYGSLYGGGGAATPPSSYGYGSLYSPPAAPDPLSYQTLYSGSGGLFQGGFPNAGGYQMPSSQGLLGYDPNAGLQRGGGGGGGIGGLGGGWGNAPQAMPDMQRLLGYTPQSQYDFPPPPIQPQPMGYDYGSLYGGGGAGNLGSRLAQTLASGSGDGGPFQSAFGSPAIGSSPGKGLNFGGFNNFGPGDSFGRGATPFVGVEDPGAYGGGYGIGGLGWGNDMGAGYTGVGYAAPGGGGGGGGTAPSDFGEAYQSLTGAAGPGGGRGGGLFQGGFAGAGGTQTPDIQRLLGYTPDLQLGISGLQKTLQEIDAATARGDRGLEPGFWERAIPDPGSTLSPQDRQIRFSGGGFRDPSFFGPGGLGGDSGSPYADSGLPLEITQGGSTPGGAMFSDFNRSLFGNAPAYPSGVVRGPYALPDVGVEGAAAVAPGIRGGALPYFGGAPGGLGQPMTSSPYFDEPAAGFGGAFIPPQPQPQYFDNPAAGFGGLTTGQRSDSPDVFGGYEGGYGSNRNMPGEMTYSPALDATFVKPEYRTANVFRGLQDAAANLSLSYGVRDENGLLRNDIVSPTALGMLVQGETQWNPKSTSPKGRYAGMTQMGRDTFNEAPGGRLGGMTYDEYLRASPAQQIGAYPDWARYYKIPSTTSGLDLGAKPPHEQAAYLQGLQFSPSGGDWLYNHDTDITRLHPQAPEMRVGRDYPSLNSVLDYYRKMNANPPWMPQTAPWAGIY